MHGNIMALHVVGGALGHRTQDAVVLWAYLAFECADYYGWLIGDDGTPLALLVSMEAGVF